MNTSEDEPLSALNSRLRPRRSTNSPLARQSNRIDGKTVQEKTKRFGTLSKACLNKPDDLANKSDTNPTPQFLCPYCDRKFASKQTVSKHTRRLHLSTSRQDFFISCLFCNHTEAEGNDIIRHMVDSHPNQYFACLECHARFTSTSELADHKLIVCEKLRPYRSKLRQKTGSQKDDIDVKDDFGGEKDYADGFNGLVISCELKPSHVHDEADIEDNITTNLILPPSKNLSSSTVIEKNAVIVLDDIQWNKRIPANFSFHNTDADQILSRLGVVHRSPRTGESTKKDWIKTIEDSTQKFEKCFDTSFYSKVASNVQENLTKCLDGSFNFNPDLQNTIKTRKSKNSVVINTAEGFPILLAFEQYSRNIFDSYMPRSIAPKHKWKWDSIENDKSQINPDQLKRDSHTNNCIITLVSSLDIWTQLCMRKKYEEKLSISHLEKKPEKQNVIDRELKEILESREISRSSSQLVQYTHYSPPNRDGLDVPTYLGLAPTGPTYDLQPAVLSGEWVRPRCYVCCACGAQTRDSRALSTHISIQHPNAQVQHYEIVGEPLLNADILKHLYLPPSQMSNRTRPLRGIRDCTKCKKSITLEDLHQHMLDCAGDTPAVRRKCRYRPFGVRRRRPRLPDNVIRRKIRKDMRNRHKQKNLLRPAQKIRSEVGDAETIRKMIADLPAKRHRVIINASNSSLRPRRKLDKQRSTMMLIHRATDDTKNRKLRAVKDFNISPNSTDTAPTNKEEQTPNIPSNDDEDNKPLKPKKRLTEKNTRHTDNNKRKAVINRARRKLQTSSDNNIELPEQDNDVTNSNSPTEQLPRDNEPPDRIDINSNQSSGRQHSGRGGGNYDGGGGNYDGGGGNYDGGGGNYDGGGGNYDGGGGNYDGGGGNYAGGGGNFNRGGGNRGNDPGRGRAGNNRQNDDIRNNGPPENNTPLKHSIARLTADCVTYEKSVQFHHLFLVQQECNNTRRHGENEASDSRLDEPPLPCYRKIPIDPYAQQKHKCNKTRKGLNDCIAMLKNKLVEPNSLESITEASDAAMPSSDSNVSPTEGPINKSVANSPDNVLANSNAGNSLEENPTVNLLVNATHNHLTGQLPVTCGNDLLLNSGHRYILPGPPIDHKIDPKPAEVFSRSVMPHDREMDIQYQNILAPQLALEQLTHGLGLRKEKRGTKEKRSETVKQKKLANSNKGQATSKKRETPAKRKSSRLRSNARRDSQQKLFGLPSQIEIIPQKNIPMNSLHTMRSNQDQYSKVMVSLRSDGHDKNNKGMNVQNKFIQIKPPETYKEFRSPRKAEYHHKYEMSGGRLIENKSYQQDLGVEHRPLIDQTQRSLSEHRSVAEQRMFAERTLTEHMIRAEQDLLSDIRSHSEQRPDQRLYPDPRSLSEYRTLADPRSCGPEPLSLAEQMSILEQRSFSEHRPYPDQIVYPEQRYPEQRVYQDQRFSDLRASYDERPYSEIRSHADKTFADQRSRAEQRIYNDRLPYPEQMLYPDLRPDQRQQFEHRVLPDQMTYAEQPPYPDQMTYPEQRTYPKQTIYPEQRPYLEHGTYQEHRTYPEQINCPEPGIYSDQRQFPEQTIYTEQKSLSEQIAYSEQRLLTEKINDQQILHEQMLPPEQRPINSRRSSKDKRSVSERRGSNEHWPSYEQRTENEKSALPEHIYVKHGEPRSLKDQTEVLEQRKPIERREQRSSTDRSILDERRSSIEQRLSSERRLSSDRRLSSERRVSVEPRLSSERRQSSEVALNERRLSSELSLSIERRHSSERNTTHEHGSCGEQRNSNKQLPYIEQRSLLEQRSYIEQTMVNSRRPSNDQGLHSERWQSLELDRIEQESENKTPDSSSFDMGLVVEQRVNNGKSFDGQILLEERRLSEHRSSTENCHGMEQDLLDQNKALCEEIIERQSFNEQQPSSELYIDANITEHVQTNVYHESSSSSDINKVHPNHDLSHKMIDQVYLDNDYTEIPSNIPPAHASTNVESILSTPLDLSGKSLPMECSEDLSKHDSSLIASNYEVYETLDLSSKTLDQRRFDNDVDTDNLVVDLRIKTSLPSTFQPNTIDLSAKPAAGFDNVTDLSMRRCEESFAPTDLSVRGLMRNEPLRIVNNTCSFDVQDLSKKSNVEEDPEDPSEVIEMISDLPTDLSGKSATNSSTCDMHEVKDINICMSIDLTMDDDKPDINTEDRMHRDISEDNKTNLVDENLKIKSGLNIVKKDTKPEAVCELAVTIPHCKLNVTDSYSNSSNVEIPSVNNMFHSPNNAISSSSYRADAIISNSVTNFATCAIKSLPSTSFLDTSINPRNTVERNVPASTSPLNVNTVVCSLPVYTLPNPVMSSTLNKYESTVPVYTLANACISVTKIESSSSPTLTNTFLTIAGTTIANTTSVYTLAGTTVGAPLNYEILSKNRLPSQVKQAVLNDITSQPERKHCDEKIHSENKIIETANTVDQDPETAKKIAMLPKELVDILGTMPADHRNQLLNVLPQYVSTSNTASRSNCEDTVSSDMTTSSIANTPQASTSKHIMTAPPENEKEENMRSIMPNCLQTNIRTSASQFLRSFNMAEDHPMSSYLLQPPPSPSPPPAYTAPPLPHPQMYNGQPPPTTQNATVLTSPPPPPLAPLPSNTPPPLYSPLPPVTKVDAPLEDDKPPMIMFTKKEEQDLDSDGGEDQLQSDSLEINQPNDQSDQKTESEGMVIDLTEDENPHPTINFELLKIAEDLTKSIVVPTNFMNDATSVKTNNHKALNDKTASLRAVRIKTPSERNKPAIDNKSHTKNTMELEDSIATKSANDTEPQCSSKTNTEKQSPKLSKSEEPDLAKPAEKTKSMPINKIQDDDEDMKSIALKISFAVQQAEISSTQQNKVKAMSCPTTLTSIEPTRSAKPSNHHEIQKDLTEETLKNNQDSIQVVNPVVKTDQAECDATLKSPLLSQHNDKHQITKNINAQSASEFSTKNIDPCKAPLLQFNNDLNKKDLAKTHSLNETVETFNNSSDDSDSDDNVSLAVIVKNREQLKHNVEMSTLSEITTPGHRSLENENLQSSPLNDVITKPNSENANEHETERYNYIQTKQEAKCYEGSDQARVEHGERLKKEFVRPSRKRKNGENSFENDGTCVIHEKTNQTDAVFDESFKNKNYAVDNKTMIDENTTHSHKQVQVLQDSEEIPKKKSCILNNLNQENVPTCHNFSTTDQAAESEAKETAHVHKHKHRKKKNKKRGSENPMPLESKSEEKSLNELNRNEINDDQNLLEIQDVEHENSNVDALDHSKSEKLENLKHSMVLESTDSDLLLGIDEDHDTPLRRSRRGKSMFVDDAFISHENYVPEASFEHKTPITKKQLIFSKMMLDEENQIEPQAHSTPDKDSIEVDEININGNIDNSVSRDESSITTDVTTNQKYSRTQENSEEVMYTKKTLQARRKNKKKRFFDIDDEIKTDNTLSHNNGRKSRSYSESISSDSADNTLELLPENKELFKMEDSKFEENKSVQKNFETSSDDLGSKDTNEEASQLEPLNNNSTMSTNKRKLSDLATDECNQPLKTKKIKPYKNVNFKGKNKNIREKLHFKGRQKVSPSQTRTRCYMPLAARRTRSKSVFAKSSSDDYDPYDIDLDDMIEKENCRLKNKKRAKMERLKKLNSIKQTSNLATPYADKNTKNRSYQCTGKRETEISPKDNASDSDDSTKSDVPLKKYIEEKEKRINHKNTKESKTFKLNEHSNIKRNNKYKKGSRRSLDSINNDVKDNVSDDADDRRSEQFMESFGFFSERKPRKSNLLASKKISETFHTIANDTDDSCYGPTSRTPKRSVQNENKKSIEGKGTRQRRPVNKKKPIKSAPQVEDTEDAIPEPVPYISCKICEKQFQRSDNYLRHHMSLFHVSSISGKELKMHTKPYFEIPNHLVVFKQEIDELQKLEKELELKKQKNPKYSKIKLLTLDEIVENVKRIVREQIMNQPPELQEQIKRQLAERGLNRDEALFLDCCQLLKYNNNVNIIYINLANKNLANINFANINIANINVAHMHFANVNFIPINIDNVGAGYADVAHYVVVHFNTAPVDDAKPNAAVANAAEVNAAEVNSEEVNAAHVGTGEDNAAHVNACQQYAAHVDNINFNNNPDDFDYDENPEDLPMVKEFDSLDKPPKGDGDVDSITAKNIFDSEEVRNMEKDLFSNFKANANARKSKVTLQRSVSDVGLDQIDDHDAEDVAFSSPNVGEANCEDIKTYEEPHPIKVKKLEVKDKMYPDVIENIDMFEDKFDKIKRKCRSQAAAAKQVQAAIDPPSKSNKGRKKAEKKKTKRKTKKSQSTQVLTKGALKGFDGIKVSIPTSEINMSGIVPPVPEPVPKKKKKTTVKKKKGRDSQLSKQHQATHDDDASNAQRNVDVYEFMDNEDEREVFELRPTHTERFKTANNNDLHQPSTSKMSTAYDDAGNTSESGSDGDDFVYMSDDYMGSEGETSSLVSYGGEQKKNLSPSKRRDALEKNAVMGRIFKYNAVRSDKKSAKVKEPPKPKADFDQLFDSLLEDEPNSFTFQNDSGSPKKDEFVTPKKCDKYSKYNRSPSRKNESSSYLSLKRHTMSPPKEYGSSSIIDYGPSTSKKYYETSPAFDYGPSTSKTHDSIFPKESKAISPKKYESNSSKKHNAPQYYKSSKHRDSTASKNDDDSHKSRDSKDKVSKEKSSKEKSTKLDEGISTSYDFDADAYDQLREYDDMGVARQRARRKCTVGKQNVLAETWSSESEPDGIPPRPTSAESVVLNSARRKKGKKRDGLTSSARRSNNRHNSVKKQDVENRISSFNRYTASNNNSGRSRVGLDSDDSSTIDPYESPMPSTSRGYSSYASTSHASTSYLGHGSSGSKPRPRSTAHCEEEQEHFEQHGWIVGDSHKKLVTMLAHAKGRKRNDDKRHFVE